LQEISRVLETEISYQNIFSGLFDESDGGIILIRKLKEIKSNKRIQSSLEQGTRSHNRH